MNKNSLIALGLNFVIPGLGYIYADKIKRGVVFYVVLLLTAFSIRLIAFKLWILVAIILFFAVLWLGSLIDVYRIVKNETAGDQEIRTKWKTISTFVALQLILVVILENTSLHRVAIINFFAMPAPSMAPTLNVGDYIAIRHTRDIGRNDIIVFKYPPDQSVFYIKRCIGMPGDSLEIKAAKVYINGSLATLETPLNYRYFIHTQTVINERVFRKYAIDEYEIIRGGYSVYATEDSQSKLRALDFVDSVSFWTMPRSEANPRIFPDANLFLWNEDFYGPLLIPARGSKLQINEGNLAAYGELIRDYEDHDHVEIKNNQLFINKQSVEEYTFIKDYYFVMGDSRHNSLDSRFWGFVPKELIYGKAAYRYWADDIDRIGEL